MVSFNNSLTLEQIQSLDIDQLDAVTFVVLVKQMDLTPGKSNLNSSSKFDKDVFSAIDKTLI